MSNFVLDTNIIILYLVDDDHALHDKAEQYLVNAIKHKQKLWIDTVALAEVIWVLKSVYKFERVKIANTLIELSHQSWFETDRPRLVEKALIFFSGHNLSYIDCYLHCLSQFKDIPLATFDTKLAKLN